MRTVISFLVVSILSVAQTSRSEDLHPVLQAIVGVWTETGTLIAGQGAPPIPGEAEFTAKANSSGTGVILKGSATYGPIMWDYEWTFSVGERQEDYTPMVATYKDSMGQALQYKGQLDEKEERLQLIAPISDGEKAKAQVTLQEDGSLLIQNVNENPEEIPQVIYNGTAKKVEATPKAAE